MDLRHKFVSPKLDSNDETEVRPSCWNDNHELVSLPESDITFDNIDGHDHDGINSSLLDRQTTPIRAGFHLYDVENNLDNFITNNNDGTITVMSAGCDFYDDIRSYIKHHDIIQTVLTPSLSATNYIYGDRETNNYNITTDINIIDDIQHVILGQVYLIDIGPNYILHSQISPALGYGGPENRGRRTYYTNRYAKQSGFDSLSVSSPSLALTGAGGLMWSGDILFNINPITSNTNFFFCYHIDGVWTFTKTLGPTINNTQYDNGTNLITLSQNKMWTINYIYRGIEHEDHLYMVLSPEEYESDILAKGSSVLHIVPELISSHAVLIGRVIVKKGETDSPYLLTETLSTTPIYTSATPVNNHNDLALIQGGTTNQYYHLTSAEYTGSGTGVFLRKTNPRPDTSLTLESGDMTLPSTSANGIKIDPSTPTFGWRDILGSIDIKGIGASDPSWAVYRTNGSNSVSAFNFPNNNVMHEVFTTFHIPHDYVLGSDLYVHVHWSQNIVDSGGTAGVPGVAEWNFDISYASGHGIAGGIGDPFNAPILTTVLQQASSTQYGHMIAEVVFTGATTDASHIDRTRIAVDGLVMVRLWRNNTNIADTLNQVPFIHFLDLHYQSTNLATKNKVPNFYG